jgi:hypothetical protein
MVKSCLHQNLNNYQNNTLSVLLPGFKIAGVFFSALFFSQPRSLQSEVYPHDPCYKALTSTRPVGEQSGDSARNQTHNLSIMRQTHSTTDTASHQFSLSTTTTTTTKGLANNHFVIHLQ